MGLSDNRISYKLHRLTTTLAMCGFFAHFKTFRHTKDTEELDTWNLVQAGVLHRCLAAVVVSFVRVGAVVACQQLDHSQVVET